MMFISDSVLSQVRKLSIKINALTTVIDSLSSEASKSFRQYLDEYLVQCQQDLSAYFVGDMLGDSELLALVSRPPKGFWFDITRSEIFSKDLDSWIRHMDDGETQEIKDNAELKLLFFFGSNDALDRYLDLHNKLHT